MATHLITGISGQDGSYLAEHLLNRGEKVVGTTRVANQHLGNLHYLGIHDEVVIEEIDLTDLSAIIQLYERHMPDRIYHLAAQSSVGASFSNPLATMHANLVATFNILEAARLLKLPTRIYHASTSEIYGRPDQLPITEDAVVSPISPYGVAKASAHFAVRMYRESYGIFAASGILFNHESFLRGENYFVKKVIRTAVQMQKDPELHLSLGELGVSRDFGFAPEYVKVMSRIIEHDTPEEFIVASGKSTRLLDMVNFIFDYLELDHSRFSSNQSLHRPNEIACQYGDPTKAQQKLGWVYTMTVEEMLEKLIEEELTYAAKSAA